MKTIMIAGGGASGMMAAITAAQDSDNRIILMERQARVGRKLLSTGNGRCNLTNLNFDLNRYYGENTDFMIPALEKFGVAETLEFFRDLGLVTMSEPDGRVYPLSNHAASVVDVLRFALGRDNIELRTGHSVLSLQKQSDGFLVGSDGEDLHADCVVVACGGAAGANLGGVMDGYRLLETMGHHRTRLYPSLVQVKTDPAYPRALKGIKANAAISVLNGKRMLAANRGEVLFTENGLSGPAIFDISRAVSTGGNGLDICLDFLPDFTEQAVTVLLARRCEVAPQLPANQLLTGALHNRLGQMVCKHAGVSNSRTLGQMSIDELNLVTSSAKCFVLNVEGVAGFDAAQMTAGGMKTEEFNSNTLESRLVPGLFACGEVLDIDGDCGGFNLQWAWSSGQLAGTLGKRP